MNIFNGPLICFLITASIIRLPDLAVIKYFLYPNFSNSASTSLGATSVRRPVNCEAGAKSLRIGPGRVAEYLAGNDCDSTGTLRCTSVILLFIALSQKPSPSTQLGSLIIDSSSSNAVSTCLTNLRGVVAWPTRPPTNLPAVSPILSIDTSSADDNPEKSDKNLAASEKGAFCNPNTACEKSLQSSVGVASSDSNPAYAL